jgi:hypothetical protein
MEPRSANQGSWARVTQREGGCAVREHGPLAIGFNHHHDAGAAAAALQERFHPSAQEGGLKGFGGSVFTNSTDEARGAPSSHGCHGNVGGAPAASSRDLGGGI